MRKLLLVVLLALSACAGSVPPAQLTNLKIACAVDGALVPLADPMIAAAVPAAAPAVGVDLLVVHPAVVALCASVGGSPVAVAEAVLAVAQANPTVSAALTKAAPAVGVAGQASQDVAVLTAAAKVAVASVPASK